MRPARVTRTILAMGDFQNPYEGKPPRKADQLRDRIAKLTQANEERVAKVEGDAKSERERIRYLKRRQKLAVALAKKTRFRDVGEFDALIAGRAHNDFTVGDLENHLYGKQDMNCPRCRYLLRGLPHIGNCPECGTRYVTGGFDWDVLRDLLADELELSSEQVTRDLWVMTRLWQVCEEPGQPGDGG